MQKIKKWINGLSVKKKLVIYGYLTITPVLLIVCICLLFYNYHTAVEEKLNTDMTSVNTLSESVEMFQNDIKDFSTYISINNKIHKILTTDDPEVLNGNQRLWFDEGPMQIVQDMISMKGHIKTIAIYPENGVAPYLRGMDGSVYIQNMEDVKAGTFYQDTVKSDSGIVWRKVAKGDGNVYSVNKNDKVVLCREIFDLTQKKTLGYIVIGISQEKFDELLMNGVKDKTEGVMVLDPNSGELVSAGNVDEKVKEYLCSSKFLSINYKNRASHLTYGNYEIICRQATANSSIVCKIVPKYSIKLLDIAYMPLLLLLGMLAGLLPLLVIISNLFTKPLRQVSEAIMKVSEGDLYQQVEIVTDDEVGEVARCFNKMVVDIRKLIDENYAIKLSEKESELAALQAQINPHFLYNTLDSLYWQVCESGNDEVAENILALSQLFRLVLNQGKDMVTVGQEADLIARYLQIQKMRFTKRMNYTIDIDERIKNEHIPKLILQPFVENAVVHGFENVSTTCQLYVTGRLENGYMHFEVKDTGIGMRQDQIDELWNDEPVNYSKQRIGRYAIKNIRERLSMKYHGAYRLSITSSVGKGVTVTLEIPCEEAKICQ